MPVYCTGTFPLRQNLSNLLYSIRKIRALIHKFVRNFSSPLDEKRDLMRFTILLPLSNETDSSI
ncbi:hypothetical protein HMPREF1604_04339 [Escherichia coli 908519]|nr:hypothetical protein HMPREF1604_04339 [Escherichia coli 908519]